MVPIVAQSVGMTAYTPAGVSMSCQGIATWKHAMTLQNLNDTRTLMAPAIDLTGQRYSRLVALEPVGRTTSGQVIWQFQCDCGNKLVSPAGDVRQGKTKSCGCKKREHISKVKFKHGLSKTGTHNSWYAMLYRCSVKTYRNYKNYGGRGITVCERWQSFDKFLEDMGFQPHGLTLERIDNNAGYSPSNCRWASRADQMKNTRLTRFLTFKGKTMCLSEWDRYLRFAKGTVCGRLKKGWSLETVFGDRYRDLHGEEEG